MWGGNSYGTPNIKHNVYGYVPDSSIASTVFLKGIQNKKQANWKYNKGFSRWFYNQFSFNYLNKIVNMAGEHDCKVLFLYLPGYGSIPKPEEEEYYRTKGTLLIPPGNILADPHNWKDEQHMNDYGARQLSAWIAEQIVTLPH